MSNESLEDEIANIQRCLGCYVDAGSDVMQDIDYPVPIVMVQPRWQPIVTVKTPEDLIRERYRQVAKIGNSEIDLVAWNGTFSYKIMTIVPPYCPLCLKTHDGTNLFQHMVFVSRGGTFMTCISRHGRQEDRYLLVSKEEQSEPIEPALDLTDDEQVILKLSTRDPTETNAGLS